MLVVGRPGSFAPPTWPAATLSCLTHTLSPLTLLPHLTSAACRSITRGALAALGYCHAAGVVHGALGSGSVMLSSFDDRTAKRLVVKLDNVRGVCVVMQCPVLCCCDVIALF